MCGVIRPLSDCVSGAIHETELIVDTRQEDSQVYETMQDTGVMENQIIIVLKKHSNKMTHNDILLYP